MNRFIAASGVIFLLALIFGGALFQVRSAKERALFAEKVAYHRHIAPPAEMERLNRTLGFTLPDIRTAQGPVPRSFLASLPAGIGDIRDTAQKKRAFLVSLLPLVLRTNELISEDRARLLSLIERTEQGASFSSAEKRWIRDMARRYGLGKKIAFEDVDLNILLRRVDNIPPSLALAQAAIESGWGTSRFAQNGNALFGQWTWSKSHKGLVPERRSDGQTHRVRAFDYLIDSVRGYMLNLNRNPAYHDLRMRREALRKAERPLSGRALAPALIRYSERRAAYVAEIETIIASNHLEDFDHIKLAPKAYPHILARTLHNINGKS